MPALLLPDAIALNQNALVRIVAGLFALLGLTDHCAPGRIARELHCTIGRLLRPAESAVRRLIVILAKFVKVKAQLVRPMPQDFVRGHLIKASLCFQLFDIRPPLFSRQRRRETVARPQPCISFFRDGEVSTIALAPEPPPAGDGLENAARLVRRLQALKAALDDLLRQANRLVRALARRQKSSRLRFKGPLRPGRPPGFRRRPLFEIDSVLHRCDWLARESLPDTS